MAWKMNRRLKRLVVDLSLDNAALKHVLKLVRPAVRRSVVSYLGEEWAMSERRTCGTGGLHMIRSRSGRHGPSRRFRGRIRRGAGPTSLT